MVATRLACASSICISWNRRSLLTGLDLRRPARLRRGSHGPEGQPDEPEAAHAGEHCGAQPRTWAAAASAAMAPANAPAVARISSMMALPRPVATTASAPAASPERRRAMVCASTASFASASVRRRARLADCSSNSSTSVAANSSGRRARGPVGLEVVFVAGQEIATLARLGIREGGEQRLQPQGRPAASWASVPARRAAWAP